ETRFTNIRHVMPGVTVTLTKDGSTRRGHWRLECRDPLPPTANRADVMAVLRDKIDRAVRRRMPTQGPMLSHLSGGLDSSAISALAARAAADSGLSVRAYAFGGRSLPRDIPIIDEQPAIDAVLAAYPNIDLHPVFSPDHELLARGAISPVFPMFDGPEDLYEQVVRDAAALGGTSILAGFGGDEVVSYAGTGGFAEMLMKGRWRALWSISRQVGRRSGRAAWRIIASEVQRFVLPNILPRMSRQGLGRSNESIRMLNRFLKPAFQTLTHDDNPELRADSGWLRAERIHVGHTVWIQEQAAQVAGRHGLRYASPLLDRDVMEFAIRLPPEFLHLDGLMRGGIRDPMDGILPDLTRMRRTKLHFDPAGSLVFARDIAAVLDCVRTLQASSAAEMFDLDLMTETLADVPDARDVIEQIRLASARGEQFFLPELGVAQPVLLARFVDTATRALKNT
ncbi:MAG: asparagine synthase-related protein, partial [Paracoccaceae bacterium]